MPPSRGCARLIIEGGIMRSEKSNSGTKAQFRTLLREAGVDFDLSDRFYREIVLSMNGNKGLTGEYLVHASVMSLLRGEDQRLEAAPKTQHVLRTPEGIRRMDLYFVESRFAIEIKSGYARATHGFRHQVQKDAWLLQNRADPVSEVMWIFLRGATKPARKHLDAHNIAWMDLDIDELRPPVTSAWPESNKSPLTDCR
jgi:hypothetical protein